MSTIVIFGSAARFAASRHTARQPRDIDVAYANCASEEAIAAAAEWAESHGLGGLPIDAHELERRYFPEGQPPRYTLRALDTVDADSRYVLAFDEDASLSRRIPSGFTTAVRVFAETGSWPYSGLGWGLTLKSDSDSYFGDGLDGLRNALDRCSPEQREEIALSSGGLIPYLAEASATQIEAGRKRIRRGLQHGSSGSGFRVMRDPETGRLSVPTYAGDVDVDDDGILFLRG